MARTLTPESISLQNCKAVREALLRWHTTENSREMPWKGEKDPYRIWLSEVILQQTRVSQGTAYYNRFIAAFPNIGKLAAAADDDVFKLWEGLGYYSRCRNLLSTARYISNERGGIFPNTYDEIIRLKGVGEYTAAAIASFAYNEPKAVLDGNVFRVLSRIYGIADPIDTVEGKRLFTSLADQTLDERHPRLYNQAIMDLGATVCKPQPDCECCPLRNNCIAYKHCTVNDLPVKSKRLVIKQRFFTQFVMISGTRVLLKRREAKDVWRHLYEFVALEHSEKVKSEGKHIQQWIGDTGFEVLIETDYMKQQLTHQTIFTKFVVVKLEKEVAVDGYKWTSFQSLNEVPFPRVTKMFIEKEPALFNR